MGYQPRVRIAVAQTEVSTDVFDAAAVDAHAHDRAEVGDVAVVSVGKADVMPLPQRLNFVTIGAWSVSGLRDFYRRWGWRENDGGSDDYVSFRVGSVVIAIFALERLAEEAAPGALTRERDRWNGVTFAITFTSRADVDRAVVDAVAAGGSVVADPVDREWGGYSGYVADVEGNRWELAWAPGFDPE